MAISDLNKDTTTDAAHHGDAQAAFIDRVAKQYEAEDAKQSEHDDGIDDSVDDEADETPGDDAEDANAQGKGKGKKDDADDDSTAEHTDEDTSADDPDGDPADSGEDSEDDEADDHPEDDESEESTDEPAPDDDAEPEQDEEEEEPATDATKAALAARGADLTLDDVPDEYRPLIDKKLRSIDGAFTRVQQEATAFRSERAKFAAEERFRTENPHLAIVEAIQAGGDALFDKVNAELEKLGDATQAEAFKIVVTDKRKQTREAVEADFSKVEQVHRQLEERSAHVESTAKGLATKAGLPWRRAELAVEAALLRKPEQNRDITDDELAAVIKAEAHEYAAEQRAQTRAASRAVVQTRTATRKAAPPTSGRPAASASPRPAAKRAAKVDHDNEESRHRAMMSTARRVLPGMKDG